MKIRVLSIILSSAALCGSGAVSAAPTLIGDTISFLRAYPDAATPYGPLIPNTTIVAGTSDQVAWPSTAPAMFNPEANSISLTFGTVTEYIGSGATFDGFVISGFNNEILSASLLSNSSGLNVSLTNGLNSISIDLNGFTVAGGSLTFAVNLKDSISNVPEPSSLALLAVGAIVLTGTAFKRGSR